MAEKHVIGVKWHKYPLCDFKTKHKSALRRHQENIHNINVKWHQCPHCNYKSKQKGNLTRHIKRKYDINYDL